MVVSIVRSPLAVRKHFSGVQLSAADDNPFLCEEYKALSDVLSSLVGVLRPVSSARDCFLPTSRSSRFHYSTSSIDSEIEFMSE